MYIMFTMVITELGKLYLKIWVIFFTWRFNFQFILKLAIFITYIITINCLWTVFFDWRNTNGSSGFSYFKDFYKLISTFLSEYSFGFLDDRSTTWWQKFVSDFSRWSYRKIIIIKYYSWTVKLGVIKWMWKL